MSITALVADDHQMFRSLFCGALAAIDVEVLGQANSGEAAIHLAEKHHPKVIFMDLKMPPGMGGIKAAQIIKQKLPTTKIIACTAVEEQYIVKELVRAGFDGLLLKGQAADKILVALNVVLSGGVYFDDETLRHLGELPSLSQIEMDVLLLLAEGRAHGQIAKQLGMTDSEINTLCTDLQHKLGAKTDAHLIAIASNLF